VLIPARISVMMWQGIASVDLRGFAAVRELPVAVRSAEVAVTTDPEECGWAPRRSDEWAA
jgi:hypothetical protein